MRTTPDTQADTFGKLGPKVQEQPKPKEEWRPTETPNIERNEQGQLRTNDPKNGVHSV